MDRIVIRTRELAGVALAVMAAGASVPLVRHALAPSTRVPLAFGCTPGEAHTYALAYASDGALLDPMMGLGSNANASSGPEQRVSAHADGTMTTTCVAQTGAEHTLAMSFDVQKGALALPDGPEQRAADLLAGTTFVTRDTRGRTRAIRFPVGMSEAGRNVVRDMLTLGQVTLPSSPAATWSAEEQDTSGRYNVDYVTEKVDGNEVTIARTRRALAAEGKLRNESLRPRAEVSSNNAGGRVRVHHAHGSPAAFVADEDVTVDLTLKVGSKSIGRTRGHLVLVHRLQTGADANAVATLLAELSGREGTPGTQSDLAASDVDARLERNMQEKELGDDNWKTLAGRLDASGTERTKVYLKLKALFLLHPETCAVAGREILATEDTHSTRFHLLTGALTAAGTKEAQQALVDATRASRGKLAHERALVGSLGMLKRPTSDTISELGTLRDSDAPEEVRGSARLALGSLAKADPALGKAFVDSEVSRFRDAKTSGDRALALLALGNAGAEDLVALARDAFEDADPQVRAAAASSLRFVTTAAAEDLLVHVAEKDTAPSVRAEALHSLGYRILGGPGIDAVTGIVRADPEEDVRMAAVQVIAKEIGHDGALEPVLEDVVRAERATGVRNAAQLALMRYRSK